MLSDRTLPRRLVLISATAILDIYHTALAPILTAHCGGGCRFEPSCSCYAKSALANHGLVRGGYLAIHRLCRCHPWGGNGYDPVPQTPSFRPGS